MIYKFAIIFGCFVGAANEIANAATVIKTQVPASRIEYQDSIGTWGTCDAVRGVPGRWLARQFFSQETISVEPLWREAEIVFDKSGGFLEVPLTGGTKIKVITLARGPHSAPLNLVTVSSPLRIRGSLPFLKEVIKAADEGRDIECRIPNVEVFVTINKEPYFCQNQNYGQIESCRIHVN